MINKWLNGKEVPEVITRSNVIRIYKKGNKVDLDNYRPKSLLNTIYKLNTAILQKRISDVLDVHLQATQYGLKYTTSEA